MSHGGAHKPGIPVPNGAFERAVKLVLETITGRRGKVAPLAEDATLPAVVAKINELLTRLQD
jgi:hypothetical protein